ncbi:MAG: hypothetical protein MUC49_20240 [Raineya sp.]|jgi:hypothetical protein|nr:hypothetical protein [Raineya sp.]
MKISSFIFLLWIACFYTKAQNSPFTGFGLGSLSSDGNIAQQLNGSTGVSSGGGYYVNLINPALLVRNTSVTFDASYNLRFQQLKSSQSFQDFTTGNINTVALALPINKKWTTAIGLKPYSNIDYLIENANRVENSDFFAYYTYRGEGGLNNLFLSNGISITKDLSVGLKFSYLFGNLTQESVSELIAAGQNSRIAYSRRNNINQITFTPAIAYRYHLEKDRKFLNIGLVYDLASNAKTRRFEGFEKRDVFSGGVLPTFIDTLVTVKGKTFLPSRIKAGISYEYINKFVISAEISTQNWSSYKSFDVSEPELTNRFQMALGTEWTPDHRSNNFWQRSTYRFGVNHTPSILKINGKNVNETNVSIGTSLAFSGGQGKLTYVHIGATAGKRGSISNNNIQERFIEAKLGVSISDVLWFYRPKID